LRAPHHELHNVWYQTLTKLCCKVSKEVKDTSINHIEDCCRDQLFVS